MPDADASSGLAVSAPFAPFASEDAAELEADPLGELDAPPQAVMANRAIASAHAQEMTSMLHGGSFGIVETLCKRYHMLHSCKMVHGK